MLKNYRMDEYGNIHQQVITPFKYGYEYNEQYNHGTYKQNSLILNTLRLATITLSIPREFQNSILDVGYGNGDFLRVAGMRFKDCFGFDISPFEIPEHAVRVQDITEGFYNVITFWDSLEHIENLDFLGKLKCNYIFISAPYCHYGDVYDEQNPDEWLMSWKHLKPNEHLHHFNPHGLSKLMQDFGYFPVVINNDVEDMVRKPKDNLQNIFTAYFFKR